jgi:hypothetical protein
MDAALNAKIGADITDLKQKMDQAGGLVKGFGSNLSDMASTLGLAFGTQQIASFALELTKLAGQADGVKQAFDKIQGSTQVLAQMQMAVKGTVSDLDLMKAAVQANNFGIPLQQMGSLFEFAYERAKATGQSVDYLVNSIVVGIGRKSPLILDNLGISGIQLKEKLNGVEIAAASIGDVAEAVGKIATESLNQTGRSAETAAEKIARIGATWDNIKVKFGAGLADLIADSGNPSALLTNFDNQLTVWASNRIPLWKKIFYGSEGYAEMAAELKAFQQSVASYAPGQPYGPNAAASTSLESPTGSGPAPVVAGKRSMNVVIKDNTKALEEYALAQRSAVEADELSVANDLINTEALRANYDEKKQSDQDYTDYLEDQNKKRVAIEQQASEQRLAVANMVTSALTSNFDAVVSGNVGLAEGLARATKQIVQSLAMQSLAGAIRNAILDPTNTINPWGAVAKAAAVYAAVSALFSGIGSTVSGYGGSGGGSTSAVRNVNPSLYNGNQQTIQVVGVLQGQDIYLSSQRFQQQNQYTRPS